MKCCSARSIRLQKINTARATAAAYRAVRAAEEARAAGKAPPVTVQPTRTSPKATSPTKTEPCRNCGRA